MMTLRVSQPFGTTAVEVRPLAPRRPSLRGLRVAILDNSKPNADVLLGQTGISPAGSKPTLWFAHRQTGEIEFTARRLDLARFLRTDPQMKSSPWTLHHSIVGFLPSGRWSDDEEQTKRVAPYLGKETIRWSEKVLRAERITTQQTLAPVTDVGAYLVEAAAPRNTARASAMASSRTLTGGTSVRCDGMRPKAPSSDASRRASTSRSNGGGTKSATPNRRFGIRVGAAGACGETPPAGRSAP